MIVCFPFYRRKKIKANWNDHNTTILLKLMLEQVEAGNCSQGQMNTTAYNTMSRKFLACTGRLHDRSQLKSRIGQLRSMYNFIVKLQTHTGLGRKPDGSIDADSTFWKDETEVL